MLKTLSIVFLLCAAMHAGAQPAAVTADIPRPKLVVGIVVDQMRWDYLYRYYSRYQPNGGFKRLLNNGFSCDNTQVPYIPTITACGHASIFTGSVPAITGITGNEWWDYDLNQYVYCTEDSNEKTVGNKGTAGQMSPRNLLVTTIGDELRLATNYRSKVIGIALKDRGAILPAGNAANAAYWYDEASGDLVSSTFYMQELPKWARELNAKKLADKYYSEGWATLYPADSYTQSTADVQPYEFRPFGRDATGFPYNLTPFVGKNYNILHVTPFGNSYTFEVAQAAIAGEELGMGNTTDMLTLSLSTPDYIGHTFGPNSVEAEDDFLRLDKDLGSFLDFLDSKIGKDNCLLFLTADHGAAHVPAFLQQHKIPTGNVVDTGFQEILNKTLQAKFKADKIVLDVSGYQVRLDRKLIEQKGLNKDNINQAIINFLQQQPGVYRAFALDKLSDVTLNESIKSKVANGFYPQRSGDIQVIFKPQWLENFERGGTTHGDWNPYDAHIPLIWYGWNVKQGHTGKAVYMTDIAPTIANMLHIQMPSGSIGQVIENISK